jgi:hypothetical protein
LVFDALRRRLDGLRALEISMSRYTLVCNTQSGYWSVLDIWTDRNSGEYSAADALDLAKWLEDRAKGYALTDMKIRSILDL